MHSADQPGRTGCWRWRNAALALLFLSLLAGSSGCTLSLLQPGSPATYERQHARLAPEEFAPRINQLLDQSDRRYSAQAHLQLGLLYLHPNNPQPDYSAALTELEAYQQLAGSGPASEISSLLGLLRLAQTTAATSQQQAEEIKNLQRNIRTLESREVLTQEEITRLRVKLRDIQRLDMQIEKKRRDMK